MEPVALIIVAIVVAFVLAVAFGEAISWTLRRRPRSWLITEVDFAGRLVDVIGRAHTRLGAHALAARRRRSWYADSPYQPHLVIRRNLP